MAAPLRLFKGNYFCADPYELQRDASERLKTTVETELQRLGITPEEAARRARLPSTAFRSLVSKNRRPSIDRADELCRALGIRFTIGDTDESSDD